MKFLKSKFDIPQFESANSAIRRYRENFGMRSGGFSLPEVQLTEIYRSNQPIKESKSKILISLPVCNQERIIHGIIIGYIL